MATFGFRTLAVGDKGRKVVESFNNNVDILNAMFNDIIDEIRVRVQSDTVISIKYENETLYFSLDGETWTPVIDLYFSDIKGDPLNNLTLKNLFDHKADKDQFDTLRSEFDASSHEISDDVLPRITALEDTTSTHTEDISDINTDIDNINTALRAAVTATGSTIMLKEDIIAEALLFSTDRGVTWNAVQGADKTFRWGSIQGAIRDQLDIRPYVEEIVSDIVAPGTYTPLEDFNNHVGDRGNPHGVTKAQVGLGNVDNTADLYKPISIPVQNALAEIQASVSIVGYKDVTGLGAYNPSALYLEMQKQTFRGFGLYVTNRRISDTPSAEADSYFEADDVEF